MERYSISIVTPGYVLIGDALIKSEVCWDV